MKQIIVNYITSNPELIPFIGIFVMLLLASLLAIIADFVEHKLDKEDKQNEEIR